MSLADSALTDHQEIIATPDEVPRGQFFDLGAVDCRGVELPVETFQRFVCGEVRITNPPLNDSFTLLYGLSAEESIQQLQMGPAALLGFAQYVIQLFLLERHSKRLQVF